MDDNNLPSRDVQPGMMVNGLRLIERGSLIASVDLHMPRFGFTFLGCTWGRTDGRDWVLPPRIRWTDRDGKHHYNDVIKMRKDTAERFQAAALDAIQAYLSKIRKGTPDPA